MGLIQKNVTKEEQRKEKIAEVCSGIGGEMQFTSDENIVICSVKGTDILIDVHENVVDISTKKPSEVKLYNITSIDKPEFIVGTEKLYIMNKAGIEAVVDENGAVKVRSL